MADAGESTLISTAETPEDFGKGDEGLYAYWMTQEKISEKEERLWIRRSKKIIKRFRDERADVTAAAKEYKKLNLLWSNVQTLQPTLYGATPKPDVDRRFKDNDDAVARLAATLLERSIAYSIDTMDFDDVMKPCVLDRLLPGRGTARVVYIPHYGEEIPDDDTTDTPDEGNDAPDDVANEGDEGDETAQDKPDPLREVVFEEAKLEYVFWEDYREGPSRVWAEVPWLRYRAYMTRDELVERFGKSKGAQVTLDFTPKADDSEIRKQNPVPDAYKKAVVHEYWDKSKRRVVWLAPNTTGLILDDIEDPLELNGFFPSPNPLLATTTTDKRIPVPDYIEYQDQALVVDDLTQRINKLTRALRARGIYAGEEKDSLQRLFDMEDDAILVPVEDFGRLSGKGGLDKIIEWVPIEQIAQVLLQLYEARDKEIQNIYQVTGISDILRGETAPEETMGAQQLKSNFATRRILPKQKDVAKFARDLIRLMGDVIARHFSAKTISMITGFPVLKPVPQLPPPPQMPAPSPAQLAPPQNGLAAGPAGAPSLPQGNVIQHPAMAQQPVPPDPAMQQYQQQMQAYQQAAQAAHAVIVANQAAQQEFDAAVALLKQDALHDFKVDIETDSTIQPDQNQDQRNRIAFLSEIVPFMEQIVPIAQGNPAFADLAMNLGMFAVKGFPVARGLEELFQKFFDTLGKMPPNPNAQGKGKGSGAGVDSPADLALRQKEDQGKLQIQQQQIAQQAQEAQAKSMVDAAKVQSQQEFQQGRLMLEAEKLRSTSALRQVEIAADMSRSAQGLT